MNLGIAGLGWWGQRLVRAVLRHSDKVRFVAANVANPARRADAAMELGLRLTDSFDSLLRDPGIDGIVIATPHSMHVEQVELAAAAGKHVFCEKPLALTAAGAERATRACAVHGVTLAVGHNRRFAPNVAALVETVKSGRLGKVLHVEGHWSNENTTRADFGAWRNSGAESLGAGMTGTGIHVLDIMTSLFGEARVVRVNHRVHAGDAQSARDSLTVLMEFGGGVSGLLATVRPTPRFWRIHVFGLDGSAQARGDTELWVHHRAGTDVRHFPETDTLRAELEAFADSCRGLAAYPVTPDHLIHCAGALENIVGLLQPQEGQHD
jgi:predicted dehydrogenase